MKCLVHSSNSLKRLHGIFWFYCNTWCLSLYYKYNWIYVGFFFNFISNLKTMTFATLVAIYKPFMSLAIINVFSEQYHLSTKSVVVHDCGAKGICSDIAWLCTWGNGIPLKCVSVKMKVNINKYIWLLLHWTKDIKNMHEF